MIPNVDNSQVDLNNSTFAPDDLPSLLQPNQIQQIFNKQDAQMQQQAEQERIQRLKEIDKLMDEELGELSESTISEPGKENFPPQYDNENQKNYSPPPFDYHSDKFIERPLHNELVNKLHREIDVLKATINQQQHQINIRDSELSAKNQDLHAQNEANSHHKNLVSNLESELSKCASEIGELKAINTDLSKNNRLNCSTIDTLNRQIKEMSKRDEINQIKQSFEIRAENQQREFESIVKNLQEANQVANSEINELKSSLNIYHDRLNRISTENDLLKNKLLKFIEHGSSLISGALAYSQLDLAEFNYNEKNLLEKIYLLNNSKTQIEHKYSNAVQELNSKEHSVVNNLPLSIPQTPQIFSSTRNDDLPRQIEAFATREKQLNDLLDSLTNDYQESEKLLKDSNQKVANLKKEVTNAIFDRMRAEKELENVQKNLVSANISNTMIQTDISALTISDEALQKLQQNQNVGLNPNQQISIDRHEQLFTQFVLKNLDLYVNLYNYLHEKFDNLFLQSKNDWRDDVSLTMLFKGLKVIIKSLNQIKSMQASGFTENFDPFVPLDQLYKGHCLVTKHLAKICLKNLKQQEALLNLKNEHNLVLNDLKSRIQIFISGQDTRVREILSSSVLKNIDHI